MQRTSTIFRSVDARPSRVTRLRALADRGLIFWMMLLACMGTTLTLNAQSAGLVIADFNNDGIPDALSPATQAGYFTLAFGVAPYGTFASASTLVPYPAGCTSVLSGSVMAGDFNGDGVPDLAMICSGNQNTIRLLLGNGDGTFTAGAATPVGLSLLVAGDFNHDGKLDLATEGNLNTQLQVKFYAGNGDGTFATAVTTALSFASYSSLKAVDLNNDSYPDLVLGNFTNQGAHTLAVFGNNQNGTFGVTVSGNSTPNTSVTVGSSPSSTDTTILTGNFFGTGLTDLGVVDTGTTPGVFIAKNTSSGTAFSFATAAKTAVTGITGAAAASFTSTFTDLLVSNGATLSVLANNGSGTFSSSYAGLTVASTATLFAAADANGDGHADIYTATPAATGPILSVNLVSGSATATSAAFSLPAGTAALTASWPGNINFTGATANATQIVTALGSTTSLSSSLNPSFAGQSVTFTATVAPLVAGSYVPTGTVTFSRGSTTLGSGPISGGIVTFSTSTLTTGYNPITATYSGDNIFGASTMTLTQQVNSNVPVLTWANPAAITYGTPLSATQLNATAVDTQGNPVAGTFGYSPALGTVLNAGTQTLSVVFTPSSPNLYTNAIRTVSIVVNQATPTINWTPTVASIVYGTALSASQLNATATGTGGAAVAGSFAYTPAIGAVLGAGTQNLGVVFTSTNSNYLGTTGSTAITVTRALPTVVWSTPANIASGTALSGTQLNASATGVNGVALPGTFVYTPAAGTVPAPGTQTLSTTFTPTDVVDYQTATRAVSLIVTDFSVVTWANPAAITYGTALSATQLNATAASSQGSAIPGTFVYTPAVGTVLNAGTQTLSVTFTPTNTTLYTVVTKTASIVVNQATATVNWTPAVASIVYGTPLGASQLNATATGVGGAAVAGSFVYTPASGAVLTVGPQNLAVAFTSTNANYLGAVGATSITVTRATPTISWTTPANLAYGVPLSATQLTATATGINAVALPGAFVYTPAVGAILTPGAQTLSTTFTPTDLVNYTTAIKTVVLTVTDITLTAFTPSTAQIGDPNKTITIAGSGFVTNSVAQVNGTAIATTYVSPTSLTATIPSTYFTVAATLTITLKNPTTGSLSNALTLAVTAPPVSATYVGPGTTSAGTQPTLNLTIPAYPIPLTATLTLTTSPLLSSGATDPNTLFANGLTTYSFTIPANTTTIPTLQLQAGTIAETITVPLVLTANGVNVTPTGLAPVVITVPTAVPTATAATMVRSGNQITVTVDGFSNTREIVQASFTFVPRPGASLSTTQITAPVAAVFTTYFATAASVTAGSSFVYTQVFNVDGDANSIGSVQVTLTNSIGNSITVTAQ